MPRTTREITPNVRARRKYTTLKHVTYFFASLLLLSWCSTLFQLFLPTQVARSEETKPEIYKIHICYTPENTPEQLRRMARSMFTVLAHLKIELWSNVVFHIFGDQLGDLNTYVDFGVSHLLHRPQLKVYLKATIHVLHERKVYSEHQKLLKEEVYVRFYIPFIIDKSVEKYLYLDTDTIVLSDITTLYNSVNLIEWTLAAGVQRASVCNLGKMLDLADERLRDLGIQDSDPCMSGGVFYVNTSRWIKEKRTERWEFWVKENSRAKLYYLGCMPPQMIVFHNEWLQLDADKIVDMKRLACCDLNQLERSTGIMHPVKELVDNGILEQSLPRNSVAFLNRWLKWK